MEFNLDEEVRCGYTITREMKRLWEIQLRLLSKLIEVCQKNNLKVFATGGTLIGAVRDKGYIPWDDDIDVVMLRPDYDKLIELSATEFEPPFFFQCAYTDCGYFRGHAQLRYDHTMAALPYDMERKRKFHQGIFIDIFVMDGVPEKKSERKKLASLQKTVLSFLWMRYNSVERKWFPFLKNCIKLGLKAFWSDARLYRYLEDQYRNYPVSSSRLVGPILFKPLREISYYKNEWHEHAVFVPFENITIPIPCEYDELLRQRFGDYMTPQHAPTLHGDLVWSVDDDYVDCLM